MKKEKGFIITLTRSFVDSNKESALEKFEYELKNNLWDSESIEIEEVSIDEI